MPAGVACMTCSRAPSWSRRSWTSSIRRRSWPRAPRRFGPKIRRRLLSLADLLLGRFPHKEVRDRPDDGQYEDDQYPGRLRPARQVAAQDVDDREGVDDE